MTIKTDLKATLTKRLDRYVRVHTTSDPASDTTPSTECQWDLLNLLKDEVMNMGLTDVSLDENGYLFATLPGNTDGVPVLGLLAHVDTAPDYNGKEVKPNIVRNYDGGNIALTGSDETMSPETFPALSKLKGHDLMTTDGTSLLGADDKAGIAIILSAIEYLQANPDIPRGKLRVGFTPDEEIGRGPHKFDVSAFGADVAYTLDGSVEGELQFENFNAAGVEVTFKGKNIHPGFAKNKLINGFERACEFHTALPEHLRPETSEDREGFIFLASIGGELENATLSYILRDFTTEGLKQKKADFEQTFANMQARYGDDVGTLTIIDQYANMVEKVNEHPYLIDLAKKAMADVGVTPICEPIRGGTDGAQLSFMGLPTPNLFTGGANFHGRFEYISLDVMNLSTNVLLNLVQGFTKNRTS